MFGCLGLLAKRAAWSHKHVSLFHVNVACGACTSAMAAMSIVMASTLSTFYEQDFLNSFLFKKGDPPDLFAGSTMDLFVSLLIQILGWVLATRSVIIDASVVMGFVDCDYFAQLEEGPMQRSAKPAR
jgi:hypothetical protein